jgi:NTP pyrophosphatase (non-canonical NTP hydrolase)
VNVTRFGLEFQMRCAAWRTAKFPDDEGSVSWVIAKAAEELGELSRAIIGEHEHRPDRGDPVHEAAQVVLVIASLVGRFYPDRNLLEEAYDELCRHEGILREQATWAHPGRQQYCGPGCTDLSHKENQS